jgi:hypothetical protein
VTDTIAYGVIAVCLPILLYLLNDMMNEATAKKDDSLWRWGDEARRPPAAATWGRHELLGLMTVFGIVVSLQVIF